MKWLNGYKMRLVLIGVVAATMFCGGQLAIADFVICDPKPVDEAINSPDTSNVQGCSFLHDGLKVYFSASRDPSNSNAREIWVIERESTDAPWGEAVNLGPNINGPGGMEIEPTISPDDLELYFWRKGAWRSTRASKDEPWGPATPYTGIYPDDFSPDGLTMYTYGPWDGGYGGADIWMVTRATADDDWGEPVNLGPNVNGAADQFSASISNDGLALFFNTWKPWRIWMSIRATTDDDWGPAVQLGPDVNGYGWVAFPEISPDGSALYFDTGTREGFRECFWQVSITPIVDLDADGIVDSADMCIMVDHWGEDYSLCDIGPMPWGDGIVDVKDLTVLAGHLFEDDRLIGHWALDEEAGNIAYDSIGVYDGILHGEPAWQPDGGMVAGALLFDGIDDHVSTDPVLNPASGSFSVVAWIKGGAPGQAVLSQADSADWLCTDSTDGCLMTALKGSGRSSGGPLLSDANITDGTWHEIALVWDGSCRCLYVDGVEVAKDATHLSGLEGSAGGFNIAVGKDHMPGTFWSGLIDDVRIYNRAVSP